MKKKAEPKLVEIKELPDAWERFEKALDAVMKAKPKLYDALSTGNYR